MDSARKMAEEALAKHQKAFDWNEEDGCKCVPCALSRLLAAEPAKVSGSVSIVRSDDPPAKPLPTCVNCGSNFITPAPPAGAEVARLTALLRECNAVCLCGCPDSEHEADDCGESCGNDHHECIRVAPAVLAYVNKLRSARALPPEVEAAAEDVVRGDWWGHYCPSCGSTFKHGPECRIGRLAKALSSARAAKGGE